MNKREQLLAETLAGDAGETFARAAAAHARRRQARKKLAWGTSAAAALALVWIGGHTPKPAALPVVAAAPAYEIISDPELVAQLKGQPVLLLKEHERISEVIFLRTAEGKL